MDLGFVAEEVFEEVALDRPEHNGFVFAGGDDTLAVGAEGDVFYFVSVAFEGDLATDQFYTPNPYGVFSDAADSLSLRTELDACLTRYLQHNRRERLEIPYPNRPIIRNGYNRLTIPTKLNNLDQISMPNQQLLLPTIFTIQQQHIIAGRHPHQLSILRQRPRINILIHAILPHAKIHSIDRTPIERTVYEAAVEERGAVEVAAAHVGVVHHREAQVGGWDRYALHVQVRKDEADLGEEGDGVGGLLAQVRV
jgi:hypothetical protein